MLRNTDAYAAEKQRIKDIAADKGMQAVEDELSRVDMTSPDNKTKRAGLLAIQDFAAETLEGRVEAFKEGKTIQRLGGEEVTPGSNTAHRGTAKSMKELFGQVHNARKGRKMQHKVGHKVLKRQEVMEKLLSFDDKLPSREEFDKLPSKQKDTYKAHLTGRLSGLASKDVGKVIDVHSLQKDLSVDFEDPDQHQSAHNSEYDAVEAAHVYLKEDASASEPEIVLPGELPKNRAAGRQLRPPPPSPLPGGPQLSHRAPPSLPSRPSGPAPAPTGKVPPKPRVKPKPQAEGRGTPPPLAPKPNLRGRQQAEGGPIPPPTPHRQGTPPLRTHRPPPRLPGGRRPAPPRRGAPAYQDGRDRVPRFSPADKARAYARMGESDKLQMVADLKGELEQLGENAVKSGLFSNLADSSKFSRVMDELGRTRGTGLWDEGNEAVIPPADWVNAAATLLEKYRGR